MFQVGSGWRKEGDGTDDSHDIGVRLPVLAESSVELFVFLVHVEWRLFQHVQVDGRVVGLVGANLSHESESCNECGILRSDATTASIFLIGNSARTVI